jgi:hypothetical protein
MIYVCNKCGVEKRDSEFYNSKETTSGKESACIVCRKAQRNLRRDDDLKKKKLWSLKNKDKISEDKRDYYRKNKESIRIKKRAYEKNRRKNDIQYKLSAILRRRINHYVSGESKPASAVRDLGCTMEYLIEHLESKFTEEMTWDNYGIHGWHIDHIIPLYSFDLKNEEEFKEACHYTNLQPLLAIDNLKKGAKMKIDYEWEY